MTRMVSSSRPVYGIRAVARMLDVPPATLRTWEERYAVVVPHRSPGGHRLYSRDQVEQLRFILERLSEGMQPRDAHRLLSEQLGLPFSRQLTFPEDDVRLLILIAERDPFAAAFTEYFLRTEGYDVTVVFSAQAGLQKLQERSQSLAIIDLLLPHALAVCQRISEEGSAVLAVSTLDMKDEALAAGAEAFLAKPLEPLQLLSTVRDLLRSSAFLRVRSRTPHESTRL